MPKRQQSQEQEQGLNPFEFRVAATDTKGHSSRQWFRCVPAMGRIIDQIVQSKKFPYRTKGDLLRHGLSRLVKWLETQGPVRSVTAEVDTMLEILRDDEFYSDFMTVFDKLGERVSSHMSGESVGEARRLLLSIMRSIDRMPEGYWRERYRAEVEKRHGHILKAAPKARLGVAGGKEE